jgi:hypothetical protein
MGGGAMKLDQLLKESRTAIPDNGFTDLVMMKVSTQESSILAKIDLSALEMGGLAMALLYQQIIFKSFFTSTGVIAILGVAFAFWFSEEVETSSLDFLFAD